jgi:ligand-binding sensor domain-containing protein
MKTIIPATLLAFFLILVQESSIAQEFTNFTTADGLPSNNVLGVAIDANNVKWFGTQEGVARFDDHDWTTFTKQNGLIDNYINCIAVDINNHVWVGTDQGISTYNGSTWASYTTADGLIDNVVACLAPAPDGSIWIGTQSGASHFDGTSWKNYTTADGLPQNMISSISADGSGNIWLGTWLGGLSKFDGSVFKTFTKADSLVDNNISAIAIDADNNKWIGTYVGITKLGTNDEWIQNYRTGSGTLPLYIKGLDTDPDGTLWAGIYADYLQDGGISKLSGQAWTSYTVENGLVNKIVQGLAVDGDDYIWIVTGEGVSRLKDQNSATGDETGTTLSVYPNPADRFIVINTLVAPTGIRIYDLTGKTVMTPDSRIAPCVIDVSSLHEGIYFVRVETANGTSARKFIKR